MQNLLDDAMHLIFDHSKVPRQSSRVAVSTKPRFGRQKRR
jgi:hypothetical protein